MAALLVDALREAERLRIEITVGELPLADRAALVLLDYPDGLGCEPLARRLVVRTAHLRDVLRDDSRFTREGEGRFSRWHVAPSHRQDGIPDGWHGPATADLGEVATPEEIGPEIAA